MDRWVAAALESRLALENGCSVATEGALRSRLRNQARPFVPGRPERLERLDRVRNELLEAVAFGRDGEVVQRGRAVLSSAWARLSDMNRDESAAQAANDVCWFVVRALAHLGDVESAREQARACLRSMPDGFPSPSLHPPDVADIAHAVGADRAGVLDVSLLEAAPPSCMLRVQGRALGALPARLSLLEGSYAVELDCGGPHGERNVQIVAGQSTELILSARLERALGSTSLDALELGADPTHLTRREAAVLARWLEVDDLWILSGRDGRLELRRLVRRADEAELIGAVAVRASGPALRRELEDAAHSLWCRSESCAKTRPDTLSLPGTVMAGAGVAALATSWVAFARHQSLDARLGTLSYEDAEHASILSSRDEFSTVAWTTSLGGSALLMAGAPLLLPQERGVPLWAWSIGAAGLAVSGIGAAIWLGEAGIEPGKCPAQVDCFRPESHVPLAPMLLSQGAILLSVPIVYLVRHQTDLPSAAVSVSAAAGGMLVGWTQGLP